MSEARPFSIHIYNQTGEYCDGVWQQTLFGKRDRLIRAWKMIGLFWGLACVAVFIPIAHFVLVPSLLILGPVVGISRYRQLQSADSAKGTCPACRQEIKLELDSKDSPPKWTYCPRCDTALELRASAEPVT